MCRSHIPYPPTVSAMAFLLALAVLAAPAAASDFKGSEARSTAPACLPGVGPGGGLDPAADLLLYGIETRHLGDGNHQVHLRAVAGPELLLSETFQIHSATLAASEPFADQAVFELLAASPELRRVLFEEGASGDLSIEIEVDGTLVDRLTWAELRDASDALRSGSALPVAVKTSATLFAESPLVPTLQIPVCGDGFCDTSPIILPEDCETCPQDCGGPCSICGNSYCGPGESCSTCTFDCGSCPTCPTNLPNENRQDFLGKTYLYTSCDDDVFNPYGFGKYYYAYSHNYKSYTVSRVKECNGSITETVVPGSISYFSVTCKQRTNWTCFNNWGYPGCWY